MAQAVSRWSLTVDTWVQCQVIPGQRFFGKYMELGQVFHRVLTSPLITIPPIIHTTILVRSTNYKAWEFSGGGGGGVGES